jgi:hypothetical protein
MGEQLVFRARLRKQLEWPSLTFTVRRRSRLIRVDQPPTCPLAVCDVRRFWWVRWAGVSFGAWPFLALTITNRSTQVVHSFSLRFEVSPGGPGSGVGTQPEGGLLPGSAFAHTNHESGADCTAACVDFVQFVNGDVWYSESPDALVAAAGIDAGRRAATMHLRSVLERVGAAAVMEHLPRIHADVAEPTAVRINGAFSFYNGVTNVAVLVQHIFSRAGHDGVEALLRSDYPNG